RLSPPIFILLLARRTTISPGKHTSNIRRRHVHHFDHHFDSAADRSLANLALQQWLGLLPEWRSGSDCANSDRSAGRWLSLSRHRDVRTCAALRMENSLPELSNTIAAACN